MKRRYLCMHTYPPEVLKETTPNCWRAPNFWICLEGINTQFLKFLPSQFPKKNHPNFSAFLEIDIKPLDFYPQSSKNRTSLLVLRQKSTGFITKREWRPNVTSVQTSRPSNRRGGEGIASPEAFLPWHRGCVACRRSCNAQPSYDLKVVVQRWRDLPPFQKSRPGVFQPYFFKELKKTRKDPRLPIVVTFGWFENL